MRTERCKFEPMTKHIFDGTKHIFDGISWKPNSVSTALVACGTIITMASRSISFLLLLSSTQLVSVAAFAPLRPGFASVQSHTRLAPLFQKTSKTEANTETIKNLYYTEFSPDKDSYDGAKPDSSWNLATQNFQRQGVTILDQIAVAVGIKKIDPLKPPGCLNLTLSNFDVSETERIRIEMGGKVDAHPVSMTLYNVGCLFLDNLFDGRPIQRFWFLETIARIPYFSYISMLHLYESLGWWRAVGEYKMNN
jgi:hypothetical protein